MDGKKMIFTIINGPNLNLLGIREPLHYGSESFASLIKRIERYCAEKGVQADCFQSNHEGALVDKIQECFNKSDGIIINPGAYTHTSIALLDALKAVNIPAVEVHISDLEKREDFRKISYIRSACKKTITGRGTDGYIEAVDFLLSFLKEEEKA